jgi:cell shape-determining protein MreD
MNLVFLAMIAAAFIVPRLVPRNEGFASAATASLVFLGLLGLATALAAGQALWTARAHGRLRPAERWLGYLPAALSVTALVALVAWLRF